MTYARLFISLCTPLVLFALRSLVYGLYHKFWPVFWGLTVPRLNHARQFRLLGWDMCATSVLLFVAALVTKGSHFARFHAACKDEAKPFLIVLFFLVFVIPYTFAVFLRYGIME